MGGAVAPPAPTALPSMDYYSDLAKKG